MNSLNSSLVQANIELRARAESNVEHGLKTRMRLGADLGVIEPISKLFSILNIEPYKKLWQCGNITSMWNRK